MFNFIKEYYRRKRINGSLCVQSVKFTNLRDVESVSFAYSVTSASEIADIVEVFKFLKWRNVKIRVLIIEAKKGVFSKVEEWQELEGQDGVYMVGYSSLDWLGDLKTDVAREFFDFESNLFINFNSSPNFTLSRVAQSVKANMKIGMMNEEGVPYSLIVGDKGGVVLSNIEYLTQIFHYLKIFNK